MASFKDLLMFQDLTAEIAEDPVKYAAQPHTSHEWEFHLHYDPAGAKERLDSLPPLSHHRPCGLNDLQVLYDKYCQIAEAGKLPHSIAARPKSVNIQGLEIKYAKPPGVPDSGSEFTETDEDSDEDPDVLRRQSRNLSPEPIHLEFTQSKLSDASSSIGRRSAQVDVNSDHSAQCLRQDVTTHALSQVRMELLGQPAEQRSARGSRSTVESQPSVQPGTKSGGQRDTQSEPAVRSGDERTERMFQRDSQTEPLVSNSTKSTTSSATVRQSTSLKNGLKEPNAIATLRQSDRESAVPMPTSPDMENHATNQPSLTQSKSLVAAQASVLSRTPSMIVETNAVACQSVTKSAMPTRTSIAIQREDDQMLKQDFTSTANINSVASAGAGAELEAVVQKVITPTHKGAQDHATDQPSMTQQKLPETAHNSSPLVTVPVTTEIVAVARQSRNKSIAPVPLSIEFRKGGQQILSQAVPLAAARNFLSSTSERETSESCAVPNQPNRKNTLLLAALENGDLETYQHPLHHFRKVYEESANTTGTGHVFTGVDPLNLGYCNAESTHEKDTEAQKRVEEEVIHLEKLASERQISSTRYEDRNNNPSELHERIRLSSDLGASRVGNDEARIGVDVRVDNDMLFEYSSTASPQSRRASRFSHFPAFGSRHCSVNVGLQPEQGKDEIVAKSDELCNAKRKSSIGLQERRVSIADVSPQLGFKDAVRAPNGVFICKIDDKKFELVVEEALDAEEGMRGVQCTAADIDADMDILFAPILIEPEPEVVKKKTDVAVQWTGSECSPFRPDVRGISDERGVGTQSNAICADTIYPTRAAGCRTHEGMPRRTGISSLRTARTGEVSTAPANDKETRINNMLPSKEEMEEGDMLIRRREIEESTSIEAADGDNIAADDVDAVHMHFGQVLNARSEDVRGAIVRKTLSGACDEVQRVPRRSIGKRTSMRTMSAKTASQSARTSGAESRKVSGSSGVRKTPIPTSQQRLAAQLADKRNIISSNTLNGVVVEELQESVFAKISEEKAEENLNDAPEASARKSLHNQKSKAMEIANLAGDAVSPLRKENDYPSNALTENEVTDGHGAESENILSHEGDHTSKASDGDHNDDNLEAYVRQDQDQEAEKEVDAGAVDNTNVATGVIQTEESMPLENAEQDVANLGGEDFEPSLQDDDNCELASFANNSGTTEEAMRGNEDLKHNAGYDMDATGPIQESAGRARNKSPLDVARVIDLDLYSTPPKRSTVLMPGGVDIKPQATPAKEPRKAVRKAVKRKRETLPRPSRKVSPNTQKRERSKREMQRLGLASLQVPSEVTALSEAPSDGTQPRRSKRRKFPPLQYWRNEKKVYERRRSQLLPTISRVVVAVDQDSEDESQMSFEALKARKVIGSRR